MRRIKYAFLATVFCFVCLTGWGQLPSDFPTVTVTTNYAPAVGGGYIFEAVNLPAAGIGYYAMILGNDGVPVWYRAMTNACWDFKVLPNGYLHYGQQTRALTYTGGGDVIHQILDPNYYPVEAIQAGNGYNAEAHDFQMLPNGNVLLLGYYLTRVDMSQVVSNGNPVALVSGAVLQELDAQRNVVWQWRAWDHYPFTSQWVNSTAAVISEFHINCLFLDDDRNLVISTPDWVKKINRQTGDIMWHLGGVENQFTFVGVSQGEGIRDFASHNINRLPNGNVLLYNNNVFGQAGSTSRAHEYALDETNKIATRVWSYTPVPGIQGPFQGSAQRLANGNTFIGWGGLPGVTTVSCTEVAGSNVVFQMKFNNTNVVSYRSFRFAYPPATQAQAVTVKELASGNSYNFDGIGVSIDVQTGGGGYNQLTVTRESYAPVYPLFQGKAPLLLPLRVSLSDSAIDAITVNLQFDVASFGFINPTNITAYYRPSTGHGLFLAQPTSYNPVTGKLSATLSMTSQGSDLGELVFAYPDLADVPYVPILNEVENFLGIPVGDIIAPRLASTGVTYSVNQALPVSLSWSPKGFARSYQLQISTNQDFSTTVVSVSYQTAADYVWNEATPGTTFFYRVKTVNEGGESDWAGGSFETVPPSIVLTFPKGGEALQRGVKYNIRWSGNIAENVNIDLYNGGALATNIASNVPDNGAFAWQVPLNTDPGANYLLRITSTTNATLSAISALTFSIVDQPAIVAGSANRLSNNRIQFTVSAPGAGQISVLGSTNLTDWQVLQSLPLINNSAVFTDSTSTRPTVFFYRLRVP